MDFTALFVDVDDFGKQFLPTYQRYLLNDPTRRRCRQTRQIHHGLVLGF